MYVYNVIYCARGSHGVQSSCWLAALFCTVQLLNLHFGDVSRGRARYDLSRWSVRWLLLYSWDAPALCWWLIGQWRTVAVVTVGVVRVMLLWFNQSTARLTGIQCVIVVERRLAIIIDCLLYQVPAVHGTRQSPAYICSVDCRPAISVVAFPASIECGSWTRLLAWGRNGVERDYNLIAMHADY